MQTIIPHLWFDKEAAEAANWYVSLIENSRLIFTSTIPDTPSGDAEQVEFQLANLRIAAISAGPHFTLNPSVSLMVSCPEPEEVDRLYAELSAGGTDLMPLGEYPFSKRYAWIQDKYGLNWQLMHTEFYKEALRIRPVLLFSGTACGQAEDALNQYSAIFPGASTGFVNRYAPGEAHDARAKINYAELTLGGIQFVVMDHGYGADFTFNEAFSFMVLCRDQAEIDRYWNDLTHVPEAEQCGWLKDQFGLSWQIVPENMSQVMREGTKEEIARVTNAFLGMKKLDMAAIERARQGE